MTKSAWIKPTVSKVSVKAVTKGTTRRGFDGGFATEVVTSP